ncbi:hypothetical protein U1Q18_028416 [Sarracenia purpurea var. burkii]
MGKKPVNSPNNQQQIINMNSKQEPHELMNMSNARRKEIKLFQSKNQLHNQISSMITGLEHITMHTSIEQIDYNFYNQFIRCNATIGLEGTYTVLV